MQNEANVRLVSLQEKQWELRDDQTIMNNKGDRYTIIAGGTSRNICKATCQPLLETDGLILGGPIYNGRSDKTPYRQFWR